MLKHDESISVHIKNLQYLATEKFKVKNDLCLEIMKEIFIFHEDPTYNLRSGNHLVQRNIRPTHYGIKTISNLGAKIWDLLPEEIKNGSSLSVFKTKIKKWITKNAHANFVKILALFEFIRNPDLQNFAIILLLEFILSWKFYEIKILIFEIGFKIQS